MSVQATSQPIKAIERWPAILPKPLLGIVLDYYGPLQTKEVVHLEKRYSGFSCAASMHFDVWNIENHFGLLESLDFDETICKFALTLFRYDLAEKSEYYMGEQDFLQLNLSFDIDKYDSRIVGNIYQTLIRLNLLMFESDKLKPAMQRDALSVVRLTSHDVRETHRSLGRHRVRPRKRQHHLI